jgi:hypothetical protein
MAGITEDDIAASQPQVRALIVERLEAIWAQVEPGLHEVEPNVRLLELGVRVCRDLAAHYRLDVKAPATVEVDPVGAREMLIASVLSDLRELEAR